MTEATHNDSDRDDTGFELFGWECPECDQTTYSKPPESGDKLDCSNCEYTTEVAEVEYLPAQPRTPLGHLAGRLGFPDHALMWSYSDWFAYLFNTTALGLGVLLGLYHAYNQNWKQAVIIFGVLLPAYFLLQRVVDAPR